MKKIISDPDILSGKPIIEGTRISVELILDSLASGMTEQDIIKEYPHLTEEDIQACLAYAAKNLGNEIVISVAK